MNKPLLTFVFFALATSLIVAFGSNRFTPIEVPPHVPDFDCELINMENCRWEAFRTEKDNIVVALMAESDSTIARITYREQSIDFEGIGAETGWYSSMENSKAFAKRGIEADLLHAGDETLKAQTGPDAYRVFKGGGEWAVDVMNTIEDVLFASSGTWVYQLN